MPARALPFYERVVHSLYFLAEAMGWRSKLRWQLRGNSVYSPDLARLLRLGMPPKPPREVVGKVRVFVKELCRDADSDCGVRVVAAAKIAAAMRLGIEAEKVLGLDRDGFARAVAERLTVSTREKPITPTPL